LLGYVPAELSVTVVISLAILIIPFLSWVFFLHFLGRLASFFQEAIAAREARAIIGRGIFLLVLPIAVCLFMLSSPVVVWWVAWPFLMVLPFYLFIAHVNLVFRQVALIGNLRQVIHRRG
jgi:hypothetical protein